MGERSGRLRLVLVVLLASVAAGCRERGRDSSRWVSGDVHVHTESLNPQRSLTLEEIAREVEAQRLDVAAVLIWGVRPERTSSFFTGENFSQRPLLRVDLETSSFPGGLPDHMIALGLRDWRFPARLFTHPIYEWALDQGAVVGAAHVDVWSPDPAILPARGTSVPADFPVSVALGRRLFLATQRLNEGFRALWYRLLSSGLRVPLAGGTDWPVALSHPGEIRTYVEVEGELTYEKWIGGIRDGRTSVALGADDRLALRAQGQPLGSDVVVGGASPSIDVEIDYVASRADTIELLVNGDVHDRWSVEPGPGIEKTTLSATESAWIAARSSRAHTGAIYLIVDGRPVRPSAEAPRYFLRYLDSLEAQVRSPAFAGSTQGGDFVIAERAEALRLCAEARGVFERIRREAEERHPGGR